MKEKVSLIEITVTGTEEGRVADMVDEPAEVTSEKLVQSGKFKAANILERAKAKNS